MLDVPAGRCLGRGRHGVRHADGLPLFNFTRRVWYKIQCEKCKSIQYKDSFIVTSTQVDIWGVGIMAYDVLVGCPPFNSDEPNATVEAILLKEVEYPDLLSDDAVDFIDQVGHNTAKFMFASCAGSSIPVTSRRLRRFPRPPRVPHARPETTAAPTLPYDNALRYTCTFLTLPNPPCPPAVPDQGPHAAADGAAAADSPLDPQQPGLGAPGGLRRPHPQHRLLLLQVRAAV